MSRLWRRFLYQFLQPVVCTLAYSNFTFEHSWTWASRPMPLASAFRQRVSQTGIGLGPLIPVPDWFRHRHFCFFRYRTNRMPGIPAFKKNTLQRCKGIHTLCTFIITSVGLGYTLHVHTASCGKRYTLHVHTFGGGKRYTLHVHIFGGEKGYTLHVHTAGGGKGYTHRCLWWCYSCNMMLKNHT